MSKVKELQELVQGGIDEFLEAYGEVMERGTFEECCGAVGVSCEREDLVRLARVTPLLLPDEMLGKVAREVFKATQGERNIADLLGAAEGAWCRLCKHACLGCVCGSAARRKADLAKGLDERFCEMFGRDVLFAGVTCDFWEFGIEGVTDEEEEEDDDVEAGD